MICEALYTGSNIFFGFWANMEEELQLQKAYNATEDSADIPNPLSVGLNRTIVTDDENEGSDFFPVFF